MSESKGVRSADAALEKIAKRIKSGKAKRIVVMAGAGISTAAGIPDFRSPNTGIYSRLEQYDLPYPEALFEINFFRQDPQPFYTLYEELYPDGTKYPPTYTHCFFKLLYDKGLLLRVFTQNIDTLEMLSGLPPSAVVEAHGSFAKARCIECRTEVDQTWLREKVKSGVVARCEQHTCVRSERTPAIKPDITFFGESLPDRFFERIRDLYRADLLLVMGTSLVVQPFASLIDEVPDSCPRVLFNRDRVGERGDLGLFARLDPLMRSGGFDFSSERDSFYQGDVDDGVRLLARYCGWEEELDKLHEETVKRVHQQAQEKDSLSTKGPAPVDESKPTEEPSKQAHEAKKDKNVAKAPGRERLDEHPRAEDTAEDLAERISHVSITSQDKPGPKGEKL